MRAILALAIGLLGGAWAWGAPAQAQALKQLRVTIRCPRWCSIPSYVAADQGFFAKQGYAFEIITTAGRRPRHRRADLGQRRFHHLDAEPAVHRL